jgi:hypothetical protein
MTDDQQQPRTTGTATSRARLRRRAVRRPTLARLALSGPSGSGKTWTALSIAEVLAPGGHLLVIDTEQGDNAQGAAELYADQWAFDTIEWHAPYDPRDLAITLDDLSALPDGERPDVVVVDSASHFWVGQGGTLDIVDGRFGGWKAGTPVQDEMISAFLRCRYHLLVCTRAKQDYQVEELPNGKQRVTKLGLAPVQRDALEYEFQVALQLDMDHRIDVGKTRAQPLAGGSWPAGQQARFAATYRDWLRSGVQLAPMADVDALREVLRTAELGPDWQTAGWPKVAQLDAERLPDAWAWVGQQLGIAPHEYEADDSGQVCRRCGASYRARWHGATDPDVPDVPPAEPEAVPDAPPEPQPADPNDPESGTYPAEPLDITDEPGPSDESEEQEAPQAKRDAAFDHVVGTLAPA